MDAGDRMILARLNQLESYLRLRLDGQSDGTYDDMATSMNNDELAGNGIRPETHLGFEESAFSLFELPQVKDMLSQPLHSQQLLEEEQVREVFQVGDSLSLEFNDNQATIRAFFDTVNIWYACVDPASWQSIYQIAASGHFREGAESCLVLLVLALGKAGSGSDSSSIGHEAAGMQYFSAAWSLMPSLVISHNIISSQCIILASAYLLFLTRPVEAWTLLSSITMKLKLHLTSRTVRVSEANKLLMRVVWNAILLESDILTELALPQSDWIGHLSTLDVPSPFMIDLDSSEEDITAILPTDDPSYLIANIHLHRLRMRISQTLYSATTPSSLSALEPLIIDLDSSLSAWSTTYLDTSVSAVPLMRNLLGFRYHSTRALIYRPVLHLTLASSLSSSSPPMGTNHHIITNGNNVHSYPAAARSMLHTSLDSCMIALEHFADYGSSYFPFAWQGGLAVVRCAITIMAAQAEERPPRSHYHAAPDSASASNAIMRSPNHSKASPEHQQQQQRQQATGTLSSLLPSPDHIDAVFVAVARQLGAIAHGEIISGGGGRNSTLSRNSNPRPSPSITRAARVMEDIIAAGSAAASAAGLGEGRGGNGAFR